MAGQIDPISPRRLGTILGTIHDRCSLEFPPCAGTLSDTSLFDELRVDPYYRTAARAIRTLAPPSTP